MSSAVDQEQNGTVQTVQLEQVDGRNGVDVTKDSVTVQHDGTYLPPAPRTVRSSPA
ncbi:hypothetical protein ACIHFE_24720 [Streptomyces sp. NPDC052396]|uniref:hypothetical protein n=1 Tax=Streptomyces sp. NPDC052396 TaxID=3365689 RepID=UPI0037D2A21B